MATGGTADTRRAREGGERERVCRGVDVRKWDSSANRSELWVSEESSVFGFKLTLLSPSLIKAFYIHWLLSRDLLWLWV